jgi:hypothetical protein
MGEVAILRMDPELIAEEDSETASMSDLRANNTGATDNESDDADGELGSESEEEIDAYGERLADEELEVQGEQARAAGVVVGSHIEQLGNGDRVSTYRLW